MVIRCACFVLFCFVHLFIHRLMFYALHIDGLCGIETIAKSCTRTEYRFEDLL